MATRTIYFPVEDRPYCREQTVSFPWKKGSKRENIRAVHEAAHAAVPEVEILEVSSASAQPEGEAVSTLRLLLHMEDPAGDIPVSTVFEASKVFEKGGPYTDLLVCTPPQVHKDERLRSSGEVLHYRLEGAEYPREPHPNAFFEWLYCSALVQCPQKAEPLSRYGAFSDIAAAADSRKYYGDTSRAAAIYVGLARAGKLDCIASFAAFMAEVYAEKAGNAGKEEKAPTKRPARKTRKRAPKAAPTPELEKAEAEQIVLSLPETAPETQAQPEEQPPAELTDTAPQPEAAPEPEVQPRPEEQPSEEQTQAALEPEDAPEENAEPEAAPTEAQPEEAPAGETPQPGGSNKIVAVPNAEQLAQIVGHPRAACLMISLGKNAGFTAKNSAALGRKAKDYLLGEYRKAKKNGTLRLNREKNKLTFPMEFADTGFHAVGQLTRSPVMEQGWKFNYQYNGTPRQLMDVLEYIEGCGCYVTQRVAMDELPPIAVQRLAWMTGEALCEPAAAEFLQGIRSHIQWSGPFSVRFPKGKKGIVTVTELAQAWEKMGLFASVVLYPPQNISCVLGDSEIVRNFLNGRWLELFAVHQVQEVLTRFQQEYGGTFSVCSNVSIQDAASLQNELDVAFLVNGEFFWVEAKSSSKGINYGKYAALCKKLRVKTDRLLLVNSELTNEECEGVSYFWGYRVANCATITQQLEEMICQQLGKELPARPDAAPLEDGAEVPETPGPADEPTPDDTAEPTEVPEE